MNFRIDLEIFRGPLDLLLYLVRKDELDVVDIPLASVTDQFLGYLDVLAELDIVAAGEFLDMAGYLIELKSKLVLPHPEEDEEHTDDLREGLVERLLEYKQFKDAASLLEDNRQQWQTRFQRLSQDLPPRRVDPSEQPIREVELWDLVSAFGRIMRDSRPAPEPNIIYDDTPITTYMERIHERIKREGRITFSSMFDMGMHKSALIGVFLAILELARHHGVETVQDELHGEIWVHPTNEFSTSLDLSSADSYDHGANVSPENDSPSENESSDPPQGNDPNNGESSPTDTAADSDLGERQKPNE